MGVNKEPMTMLPVMSKLKDNEVAKVTIYFDGSGDSGEVSSVECYDEEEQFIELDVYGDLEDWAFDKADDMVQEYGGDWVNNDGGYGYIYIDVKNKTYSADYYQRTTEKCGWDDVSIFQ